MAKKDDQNRLLIPQDIWNNASFSDYINQSFAFFITNDKRVIIAHVEFGKEFAYEFIGNCKIDNKHRFILPENVDACLGSGDTYYFSSSTSQSVIYLQKTSDIDILNAKNFLLTIQNLINGMENYLTEDIND